MQLPNTLMEFGCGGLFTFSQSKLLYFSCGGQFLTLPVPSAFLELRIKRNKSQNISIF